MLTVFSNLLKVRTGMCRGVHSARSTHFFVLSLLLLLMALIAISKHLYLNVVQYFLFYDMMPGVHNFIESAL